jgi:hypothetical protein
MKLMAVRVLLLRIPVAGSYEPEKLPVAASTVSGWKMNGVLSLSGALALK